MSKVAVASTDGITINEHFGRAKEFWIYEVAETGAYTFLERREIPQDTNASHTHAASKTIELLADVAVVLAAQIGRQAEAELQTKGILSFALNRPVDKALVAYGKRGKYIKGNAPLNATASCGANSCGCSHGCR
ncbi:NifB/NifX family molybdenum-iron cluster-binding protein [Sporomusa sp. KB1]|jgi:nitrogen fixation protein NifB|uniref:NifB/NifX family molybdenum-iron cluster-binding protein n=1 Tax=Sporomusa sp. KB1 TaxID=943346 RepID=UPI00119E2A09|nr:NifB/NifX family molybdenum-iron cluster-binding protein [Sporomusa sp. KB1]TWH47521.1 nitrogen fixation protein NifB [Sporomusa sp. KB1]